MSAWVKIAIRNIFKNKRRSLYTILVIALGFASVNIFGGFTEYMYTSLKDAFIYTYGNGHLSVFKRGYLDEGKLDPTRFLIKENELDAIKEICKTYPGIVLATPRLEITGLVSNGKVSTIFFAYARVPSDLDFIRRRATGMLARLKLFNGKKLEDDVPNAVGLGSELARKLDMGIGSTGNLMSPTVEGLVNAVDIDVAQTFESPMAELNDKLIYMNLRLAQNLYDTTSVGSISLLLSDTGMTNGARDFLLGALDRAGLDMEIRTWEEMSSFYRKVRDMFEVIFLFVFIIVFVIVVMSVVNTISMSILERTREIGTMRALGLKRSGVVKLFVIESVVMGTAGSILGMVVTLIAWLAIRIAEPTWVPPQITRSVPLEVFLVPSYLVISFFSLVLLSALAATVPAKRAAYGKSIVDALGYV
ncbi:MAG: FtsX-like permease family protein [Desulfobacteraceae bacterium]|nr:FtsX-like permease family protein [Desulfobacteraceae bacterium]